MGFQPVPLHQPEASARKVPPAPTNVRSFWFEMPGKQVRARISMRLFRCIATRYLKHQGKAKKPAACAVRLIWRRRLCAVAKPSGLAEPLRHDRPPYRSHNAPLTRAKVAICQNRWIRCWIQRPVIPSNISRHTTMSKKKPNKPQRDILDPRDLERAVHVVRGQRVMLDSDLARLYGVSTMRLNEQVTRNRERFPDDFAYQLTLQEVRNLISQNAISSSGYGGYRKLP